MEGIAIGVAVIGEQVGDGEFERHIFGRGKMIGCSDWRAVGRCDVDIDMADARAVDIVGDNIVETGVSIEIMVGREQDIGAVIADRAMRGVEHANENDRIIVNVAIIGEQRRRADDERRVFKRLHLIGLGSGWVLHRRDMDGHGSGRIALPVVSDDIVENIIARIGGVGHIGQGHALATVKGLCDGFGLRGCAISPREDDGIGSQDIKRHRRPQMAGSGIENHPVRQGSAIGQRCRPDARRRNQPRRWRYVNNRQIDGDGAIVWLKDLDGAVGIFIPVKIISQQVGERKCNLRPFADIDFIGIGIRPFRRRQHIIDDDRRLG